MKKLLTILLVLAGFAWSSDVVILVNSSNPATSISKADLKKIYFGKKTNWDNGQKVVSLHLSLDSDAGAGFTKLIETDENTFKAKWLKIVFSGKATPPQILKNSKQAENMIALIEGGIAVVGAGYAPTSPAVKVIPVK